VSLALARVGIRAVTCSTRSMPLRLSGTLGALAAAISWVIIGSDA
jgi:hypothetical protein